MDDCIAVGQRLPDGDERVVLFVKPVAGRSLDAPIVGHLKSAIAARLSRRHVPALILQCPDIPTTASYKRVEIVRPLAGISGCSYDDLGTQAVKKLINGTPLDVRALPSTSFPK